MIHMKELHTIKLRNFLQLEVHFENAQKLELSYGLKINMRSIDLKVNKAKELMNNGASCSQAVLCAFCDETGLSDNRSRYIASPYAGGAHIVCGAILSAEIVLNIILGEVDLDNPLERSKESNSAIESLRANFLTMNKSLKCRELRGGFGKPKLRSCIGCVEDAVKLLENILERK